MRRTISAVLALSALATIASVSWGGAAESRCDTDLVVFSGETRSNLNAVPCIPANIVPAAAVIADGPVDFRLIWPGSEFMQVRYAADDVPGTPSSVRARVSGLGLNRVIFLGRADADPTGTDPSYVYDGPPISIDPNAQGCVKVDAWHQKKVKSRHHGRVITRWIRVWEASTTYHTVDTVAC
jgi:hypothetical protein